MGLHQPRGPLRSCRRRRGQPAICDERSDTIIAGRGAGLLEGGADAVGDEREGRAALLDLRLARVMREHEDGDVEGRVVAPPGVGVRVAGPRALAAAEHLAAHDHGADALRDLGDDLVVGAALAALLHSRVEAFNTLARGRTLRYPRYEGGFFVTVFNDDAMAKAAAMRVKGVFVVPQVQKKTGLGALRVALCAVAERDIARLVDALA